MSTHTEVSVGTTEPATWTDLVKMVDSNEGISMISMETLRKLEGAQRLGVHVLKSIEGRLGTLGLGHLPNDLPNRQDQATILYRYGTPASEVVSAVRKGLKSPQEVKNTYKALYNLNMAPDTTQVVLREDLDNKLTTAAQVMLDLLSPSGRETLIAA